MKRQYLRQGTAAVNWSQIYELDFTKIISSDAIEELVKISSQLLYGDFRSVSDPQYHAYCYSALQALQLYGQYLAGIYYEQTEKLTEAQNLCLKAETVPSMLKKRLEEYQRENKHLKETVKNITEMNTALLKASNTLKERFNSIVPLLQMLPHCRCGKTFISKELLVQHMQNSHPSWSIPADYEEDGTNFAQSQSNRRQKPVKKKSTRRYKNNSNISSESISSEDSDLQVFRESKDSRRRSKRLKDATTSVKRAQSSSVALETSRAQWHMAPHEQPRSSSYAPPSNWPLTEPHCNKGAIPFPSIQALPVMRDNGQLQYILPNQLGLDQQAIPSHAEGALKDVDIEKLVEKAVAQHLDKHSTFHRPTQALPPPLLNSSAYPCNTQYLDGLNVVGYQPEDYEIQPTSKSELRSPTGFRQADEPRVPILESTAMPRPTKGESAPVPYYPVPNYVSSQLGSESIPSLYEPNPLASSSDQYMAPHNPTILQASAPIVTETPNAVFAHPADNILSPFQNNQMAELKGQPPANDNTRSLGANIERAEDRLLVDHSTMSQELTANMALNEQVHKNWPELFQKTGSVPQSIDLTEPEILRRISVLNRSINNAVTANQLNRPSASGYHSSLSTYDEYGSTLNDHSNKL